jgi:hypothetical protein
MSIAPEEFLVYINGALDGMVQIVEAFGTDARCAAGPWAGQLAVRGSKLLLRSHFPWL